MFIEIASYTQWVLPVGAVGGVCFMMYKIIIMIKNKGRTGSYSFETSIAPGDDKPSIVTEMNQRVKKWIAAEDFPSDEMEMVIVETEV